MTDTKEKTTLADIVKSQDANSEEVKQNDIAKLRARIEEDRNTIEDLQRKNHTKKIAIIWLSIVLGLLVIGCVVYYCMCIIQPAQINSMETNTETLVETITEDVVLKQANEGNAESQYTIAERYLNGTDNYEKDEQQAIEWYIRSATNGNVKSMLKLADYYSKAEEPKKDNKSAFKYYFLAAKNGNKEGLYNVGKAYYYGVGVEKNTEKAIMYLEKAAQQGLSIAQTLIAIIKENEPANVNKNNAPVINNTKNNEQ